MRMASIPRDKINYHKVSKYANILIFKELYPKTKNVSYYLKRTFWKTYVYQSMRYMYLSRKITYSMDGL